MSGIDFTIIKNAIQSWVVAGSGLAGDHVVWSPLRDAQGNPVPRPVGTFVSLSLPGFRSPGFDDQSIYTVNANVMSQTVVGPRILVLFVQVYQGIPTGGNDIDAMRLLNQILVASERDDINDALGVARVAIGTYDNVQQVPSASNPAKQELRAYTQIKLHVGTKTSFASPAGTGWISDVTATGTLTTEKGPETVTVHVTDS